MTRAYARTVVAVEVLVKEYQVVPMGIRLIDPSITMDGPVASAIAKKGSSEPTRRLQVVVLKRDDEVSAVIECLSSWEAAY
jgi:hypothetical protein